MGWYRRFRNLVGRERLSREIRREIDFHLAERTDDLVAGGMSPAEARREARRRLGNPELMKERTREVDLLAGLESLLADARYALRALWANPGFALVALLSLGLGIGANTAIFSLIDAVMLRPLPVRAPGELVQLTTGKQRAIFTNPLWEAIRDRQQVFSGVLAFADQRFNLAEEGPVDFVPGAWVSGDYFRVLGLAPEAGRLLTPADDVRGCPGAAVVSDAFARRRFGGAEPVGRSLRLDGHSFPVVGVAPAGFSGIHVGRAAEVYLPLCTVAFLRSGRDFLEARNVWYLHVVGRLGPGSSLAEARAGLGTLARPVYAATLPQKYGPDEQRRYLAGTLTAKPAGAGLSDLRKEYGGALLVLLLVVGVVLLVACANVAELLLARASARRHEIAVRLALGCSRARLVRQLLTESVLLALGGAAAGLVFAGWSSRLLVGWLSAEGQPVWLDLSLDTRVLGFTVAVAVATGLLFGLVPALKAVRAEAPAILQGAARESVGERRGRIARVLVVGQVALSLLLVTAAGLLVGSFRRLVTLDPGFDPDGVLVVDANWTRLGRPKSTSLPLVQELVDRLRAVPGARSVAASLVTPISGSIWDESLAVEGYTPRGSDDNDVRFNGVTEGYLRTLGTRLLAGRDVTDDDGPGAPRVVLVNETLARKYYGDPRPLGRSLRILEHGKPGPPIEIVGVVEDAKYGTLDEGALATAYVPLAQTEIWWPSITLSLRARGSARSLIPAVTTAVAGVSPEIALQFTTLETQVAESVARPRLLAALSGFFGGLALLLAVVGLYGTMAYSVSRRRTELGVRMALGAARGEILTLVAGEAGRLVAAGVALGALLALAATRTLAAFLYGVTATDPLTLALSALTLALVATLAGLGAAWRAARTDPVAALREG